MGPKDCEIVNKNEKKKKLGTSSVPGVFIRTFLYSKTVKIAYVEVALKSLSQCLQANSSSRQIKIRLNIGARGSHWFFYLRELWRMDILTPRAY